VALAASYGKEREFQQKAMVWNVSVEGSAATIYPSRRLPRGGGFEWDGSKKEVIALTEGLEALALRLNELASEQE
jgi:hypothetical protein